MPKMIKILTIEIDGKMHHFKLDKEPLDKDVETINLFSDSPPCNAPAWIDYFEDSKQLVILIDRKTFKKRAKDEI